MLNPTATTTVRSTVSSDAEVMTVDFEGMGTVLSILSNMYSDGSLAAVREYSCNALDSHREAGNTDPILVTSPSLFDPRLIIQDFGVGLSRDEMLNVYARYGVSTKRGCKFRCGTCDRCVAANGQIGAFGIGAKSAFTVGTQFVVTAVKDGKKTVVLFALNEDGAPTVNPLSHEDTLEPNGVTVEIGVRDTAGIVNAIDRLFATWKPGTVLVDGVQPASIWSDAREMADNIHMIDRPQGHADHHPAVMIVMGGVPYRLPQTITYKLKNQVHSMVNAIAGSRGGVVLTVPIGAVDITPNREELRDTAKTIDTINERMMAFHHSLIPFITAEIDNESSYLAGYLTRNKLRETMPYANDLLDKATWRGRPLTVTRIATKLTFIELRRKGRSYYGERVGRRFNDMEIVPASDFGRWLFVVNTPQRRDRSVQLAAKPYLHTQDKDTGVYRVVVLNSDSYTEDWFDTTDPAIQTVEFDDFIKQWKPASVPGDRKAISYEVIGANDSTDAHSVADLKDLDDVIYLEHDTWGSYISNMPFWPTVRDNNTVILLGDRQTVGALLKRVPNAEDAMPLLKQAASDYLSTLSAEDASTLAAITYLNGFDYHLHEFLINNRNAITNPVVVQVLVALDKAKDLRNKNQGRVSQLQKAAGYLNIGLQATVAGSIAFPNDLYRRVEKGLPLLHHCISWGGSRQITSDVRAHLIQYINTTTI